MSACVPSFARLENHGIAHCVLRNHEALVDGSEYRNADLDLLVRRRDLPGAHAILVAHAFEDAGRSTVRDHLDYVTYLPRAGALVAVDLHLSAPSWNDVPYFDGERLLEGAISAEGVRTPNDDHRVPLLALHCILDKKAFKPEYAKALRDASLDADALSRMMRPHLGSLADPIAHRIASADMEGLLASRRRLVLALLWRSPSKWPKLVRAIVAGRWKRLRRRLWKNGVVHSFIGPDGSGKSSARRAVEGHLRNAGIPYRSFYMGRWRNQVLPLASGAKVWGTAAVPGDDASLPTAPADPVVARRSAYTWIRETAYLVDALLRYLLRVLPARRRTPVVILERSALDLVVDPASTPWTSFALRHLLPRPHRSVYLRDEPHVLWARKKEQSREEIARQVGVYDQWIGPYGLHVIQDSRGRVERALARRAVLDAVRRT